MLVSPRPDLYECIGGQASAVAVDTTKDFANSMHWATFRATLRRGGSFRRDLNAELCLPMTRTIANRWGTYLLTRALAKLLISWVQVFKNDLLAEFEQGVKTTITEVIDQIEDDAAPGLRDRCNAQGAVAKADAEVSPCRKFVIRDVITEILDEAAMSEIIALVQATLKKEQKEVSRALLPHVRKGMMDGYQVSLLCQWTRRDSDKPA